MRKVPPEWPRAQRKPAMPSLCRSLYEYEGDEPRWRLVIVQSGGRGANWRRDLEAVTMEIENSESEP